MFANYAEFSKDEYHYLYDYYEDLLIFEHYILTKGEKFKITKEELDNFIDRDILTSQINDFAISSLKVIKNSVAIQKKKVLICEAAEDPSTNEILFSHAKKALKLESNIPIIIGIKIKSGFIVSFFDFKESKATIIFEKIEQEECHKLLSAFLKQFYEKEPNEISKMIYFPKNCRKTIYKLRIVENQMKMLSWVFWFYFDSLDNTDITIDDALEEFKQRVFWNIIKKHHDLNVYPNFTHNIGNASGPPKILEIDPDKNILQNRNSFIARLEEADQLINPRKSSIKRPDSKETLTFSAFERQMTQENVRKLNHQKNISEFQIPKKMKTSRDRKASEGSIEKEERKVKSLRRKNEIQKIKEEEMIELYKEAEKYKKIIERKKQLNARIQKNSEIMKSLKQMNSIIKITKSKNPQLDFGFGIMENKFLRKPNIFPLPNSNREILFTQSSLIPKNNSYIPPIQAAHLKSGKKKPIHQTEPSSVVSLKMRDNNLPPGNFVNDSKRKLPQLTSKYF